MLPRSLRHRVVTFSAVPFPIPDGRVWSAVCVRNPLHDAIACDSHAAEQGDTLIVQKALPLLCRRSREASASCRSDRDRMKTDFTRQVVAKNGTIFLLFTDEQYHFLNVSQRFIKGFSLAVTTREQRTLHNVHSSFIPLDNHRKRPGGIGMPFGVQGAFFHAFMIHRNEL